MSDPLFTIGLYLFSSLLQADAAILGFGAIFIIYKLQALDNRFDSSMNFCRTSGYSASVDKLLTANDNTDYATILSDVKNATPSVRLLGKNVRPFFEEIYTIPVVQDRVKSQIRPPLIVISIHTCVCALLLLLLPAFLVSNSVIAIYSFWVLGSVIFLGFSWGILLAARVAWVLVSARDELSLEKVDPELFKKAYPNGVERQVHPRPRVNIVKKSNWWIRQ